MGNRRGLQATKAAAELETVNAPANSSHSARLFAKVTGSGLQLHGAVVCFKALYLGRKPGRTYLNMWYSGC